MSAEAPDETVNYPSYVLTATDRVRWDNAGKVARDVLGEAATAEAVWQMQRVIFHDRDTYPD